MSSPTAEFWQAIDTATDPTAYRPARSQTVEAVRLTTKDGAYYVLKEPTTKSYLRLSEEDYALWWQMDGRPRVKDLLFYNLKRYKSLPIGHLTTLINELRQGHFLQDKPVNLYDQVSTALVERAPASRGRRLLQGVLHSEYAVTGLDPFFARLYQVGRFLFHPITQVFLLAVILIGSSLFTWLYLRNQVYALVSGGLGVISLIIANVLVIGIHELAHGLATKHVGRELDRGGALIYWGMPAFFVDTRDIWMSSRRQRILVTWAGPHSGLIIGSVLGIVLTAVALNAPELTNTLWASFLYQVAFLAFLSVFVNLNPLLELDGYFILMDWLEMPGLRQRSFHFLRHELPARYQKQHNLRQLWHDLDRDERIFTFFGVLAFIYSIAALWLAFSFWQTRILPFIDRLWQAGTGGRLLVLLLVTATVVPTVYYLLLYGWTRIRAGLEWLARRDLLARADVLALLTGLPIMLGLPFLWAGLSLVPRQTTFQQLFIWLLHLATIAALLGVARQLPGSRFQWAIGALTAVPVGLAISWLGSGQPLTHDIGLIITAGAVLAAGIVSWFTLNPSQLRRSEQLLIACFLALGIGTYFAQTYGVGRAVLMENGRWLAAAGILFCLHVGLSLMVPLLLNFRISRFALPWLLITLSILSLAWLQLYPALLLPVLLLWLYATALYLLLGALAQFSRTELVAADADAFSERERLVNGFNQFMTSLFASYEAVFGQRRLATINAQMAALGVIDPDASILQIAERARKALLLAVDRLDDLAGTPFTRKAGQAAYDSLPWLQAEALGRYVLADTDWGTQLAQGFISNRDRREELMRQADIFAGFDQSGIKALTAVMQQWHYRAGQTIAQGGQEAAYFFLVDDGEVSVLHNGLQVATVTDGGYFGTTALAGSGDYQFTYKAHHHVTLLVVPRDDFDPLLRADTTLAQQVQSGAQARSLLKRMPLFSSLSPQELATVDARLKNRHVATGEVFVREGSERSHLFIVAEGLIEVFVTRGSHDMVIGRLGPGEHFGEYALFADTPYHASCRAVEDTRLLLLDEAKFDELVAACDRMTQYVEQIGSGRLLATRRRLDASALVA